MVIPAHNESGCIASTIQDLFHTLSRHDINHEIMVINDNSTDNTESIVSRLQAKIPTLRLVNNEPPNGFGFAVRKGLYSFTGDAVAIFMADESDSCEDLVLFYQTMVKRNLDCVFGSRFSPGGRVIDYPWFKKILNRAGNKFIQLLFALPYNDVTNAFKLYRRETIMGLQPFLSPHFNLTVELPLKAIIRGYHYTVLPNKWTNRRIGKSKFWIKEMGSRYLFIVLYCFIEKWLTRGDYHRQGFTIEKKASPTQEELSMISR